MTSIMTNPSAIAALDALRTINTSMEQTQSRVSSGYRVETADDNAAYWSIATTMRSDNLALSAVEDSLALGAAKVDTAYTGMEAAIDLVDNIKAKLVAAREPGVDAEKINKEISELKKQIRSVAESASFSGENWLYHNESGAAATRELVSSFNRAADGTVSVSTIDFNVDSAVLIGDEADFNGKLTMRVAVDQPLGTGTTSVEYFMIESAAGSAGTEIELTSATSDEAIEGMIMATDAYLLDMTDIAATLGATKSRLEMQTDFVADLRDTIDTGVGRLVDADMNEESTKLKALQTQQQLGIQSLSIANSNSQNILSLFQ